MMIASKGKPGSPGRGTTVLVSVVLVSVVALELVEDVVLELVDSVAEDDVLELVDSLVEEDVVDEVVVEVVLVISISIDVPQCTSVPNDPAAQPSSDAMKLAL